jgi:hypothetical protein
MRCKNCKLVFEKKYPFQKFCDKEECFTAFTLYLRDQREKQQKKAQRKKRVETKKKLEALEPQSYWVKKLQVVFNTYIRTRDKGLPCISCNRPLGDKYDAGHYFSAGAYPELRFIEDNVHAQCVACNQHNHGNLIEYTEQLPKRIGVKAFNELKNLRHKPRKYGISELKEMIEHYKQKTKSITK